MFQTKLQVMPYNATVKSIYGTHKQSEQKGVRNLSAFTDLKFKLWLQNYDKREVHLFTFIAGNQVSHCAGWVSNLWWAIN